MGDVGDAFKEYRKGRKKYRESLVQCYQCKTKSGNEYNKQQDCVSCGACIQPWVEEPTEAKI